MSPEPQTPAAVAQTEAARQIVILVFGIAGVLIVMQLQKRSAREIGQAQRAGMLADDERTDRMSMARRREQFWARVAIRGYRLTERAYKLAEKARLDYEQDTA